MEWLLMCISNHFFKINNERGIMSYQKSLDWIHAQDKFSIKPGLERMFWVLEKLGNPQEKIKGDSCCWNKWQRFNR